MSSTAIYQTESITQHTKTTHLNIHIDENIYSLLFDSIRLKLLLRQLMYSPRPILFDTVDSVTHVNAQF